MRKLLMGPFVPLVDYVDPYTLSSAPTEYSLPSPGVRLEAWSDVLRILEKVGMRSIQEFDDRFQGSQSLFNWIQDLEGELWNAELEVHSLLSASPDGVFREKARRLVYHRNQ
jgi:hypothetical protein